MQMCRAQGPWPARGCRGAPGLPADEKVQALLQGTAGWQGEGATKWATGKDRGTLSGLFCGAQGGLVPSLGGAGDVEGSGSE